MVNVKQAKAQETFSFDNNPCQNEETYTQQKDNNSIGAASGQFMYKTEGENITARLRFSQEL